MSLHEAIKHQDMAELCALLANEEIDVNERNRVRLIAWLMTVD